MPFATTDDGVKLYFEETGAGAPIVFVHEFAADHRSWEMQMRHFGQRYRAVAFAARDAIVIVGAGVAILLLIIAFVLGRRGGAHTSTIIEVKRA